MQSLPDNQPESLSALSLRNDPERYEALVARILARARESAPPPPPTVAGTIANAFRPLLAAAAMLMVVAGSTIRVGYRPAEGRETLAIAVGIPHPIAVWAMEGRVPTMAELPALAVQLAHAGHE